MILNANVDFVKEASDQDQKAFLRPPKRVLIADGTQIYRWTDHRLEPGPVRPWWSFLESRRLADNEIFDGFRLREERARRIGKTHREYARARLALSERFNNDMTLVVIATLKVMVWGFCGKVAAQPEFADKGAEHILFIGGSYQLWIPRLEYPEHLRDQTVLVDGAERN